MNAVEFRKSVIAEFRDNGFSKNIYQEFDGLLAAITCLLKICISRFVGEVSKIESPHDIFAFIVRYNASNTTDKDLITFKHLCKSIFSLIPKLRFRSDSKPLFPKTGSADISQLMGIHNIMQELSQVYGIVITYQSEIGRLFISDDYWSFNFNDDEVFEMNNRFNKAVSEGALLKYCDDDFVGESFIDIYRSTFKDLEDQLYNRIFNSPSFFDCDNLSEKEFIDIISGNFPKPGIVDVTDIVLAHRNNPYIKGLVFEEDNSNLFMALTKPHNRKYRTRFRPLIQVFIDNRLYYVTTQGIYFEAMSEIGCAHFAHNELPEEWSGIKELKKEAKSIFKRHSDVLEDSVASILNGKYMYLKNVKSLTNVSCVKAPVIIDGKIVSKKTVGEIDFIIIDDVLKSIYVVDAKFLKPSFFFTSFAIDADKFRKEGGYEEKLSYKIEWVRHNIQLLCRQIKRKDIENYAVKGFFVTDNLVYYSLFSRFPIIPISNVLDYLKTSDRYCFLPTS
ncbi:MAG: hypothetical protein HDR88_12060 [Bacteroides sp.]|nr:hypothetical protein [Bacteroides sp.]